MVRVEHALYSPNTRMAIADIELPIEEGGEFISFPLEYQYPVQGRWEEGGLGLILQGGLRHILTHQVFSPDLVLAGTQQPSRSLFLRDLGHPKYRLRSPLPVVLEVDGPHVVAYSHDLDMFGWGDVEDEALLDFKGSVCELYEGLHEEPAKLGPHLERVLRYLERVIAEEP
ncbi:MAG: hypothetical protein HY713_05765 [candidate division NC10 bacterium]|nr:hypothetical protein [candidate division NC10 bacterium]